MVFVFLRLDDIPIISDLVIVHNVIHFKTLHTLNVEKVIYDSNGKVKQQFPHKRMRFYLVDFGQNILFSPLQLYELSPYCEI